MFLNWLMCLPAESQHIERHRIFSIRKYICTVTSSCPRLRLPLIARGFWRWHLRAMWHHVSMPWHFMLSQCCFPPIAGGVCQWHLRLSATNWWSAYVCCSKRQHVSMPWPSWRATMVDVHADNVAQPPGHSWRWRWCAVQPAMGDGFLTLLMPSATAPLWPMHA